MRRIFLSVALSLTAAAAMGAQLELSGEYGCADLATQKSRTTLMRNIVSEEPHYVAQRQEMRESLLNLSTYMCQPLSGVFPVVGRSDGLIQVKGSDGSFWVTP
ncbi:hypothetical protein OKW98_18415 [Pseudomonas sp. KU26590]|uniref:hypothetical protein n=1 Tax=Pseudomonas sp. KU26590 TaxID=2991051 RepID=UPI00223CD2E3|nr:hypothetical protein [Pseudomonas sp. KU26590]UZJ58552.1 hypothetical protein OKW98_18415 [Pseudomonas sp. KU26590]